MISLSEIRRKAENFYFEVLRCSVVEQEVFPKSVRSNKDLSKDFGAMNKELAALIADSKERKGYGYSIRYSSVNTRGHGLQDIPVEIVFETLDDYIRFLGRTSQYQKFLDEARLVIANYPNLRDWVVKNCNHILACAGKWDDLMKVCRWFTNEFEPGKFYIRELPIAVHTKFIEENKNVLRSLLDELISDKIKAEGRTFEERFSLKYSEPLVRFRVLDDQRNPFLNLEDISLPINSFASLSIACGNVYVVENLMNFLTFPRLKNSLVIWGQGFALENLRRLHWLQDKFLFYWSDIDVQGFQMLAQIRSYYPQTVPVFMSRKTLVENEIFVVKGTAEKVPYLPNLKIDELEFCQYLCDRNIRLEQEKIPQDYINHHLLM